MSSGQGLGVAETHISWLFFVADHVYKVKKPVRFGFVDLTDRDVRKAVCQAEVDLNRRLAPDVYEGVGSFVGPSGEAEPIVVMKRLPAERRLSALVERGAPGLHAQVDRIAALLADFHRSTRRGPEVDQDCTPEGVATLWRTNLTELRSVAGRVVSAEAIDQLGRLAEQFLAGRASLFLRRIAEGRAVDGHGDLLADDIFCLGDGPRILDCLEFDDSLRHVDTLLDLTSLVMDLERLGRPDLGDRLLASYGKVAGDAWPPTLAHFYVAYRATVRAKVACIRAQSGDIRAGGEAQQLVDIALRRLKSGSVRLVLVGGLPGTGKSTLAEALRRHTGWALLRSDVVRKDMVDPRTEAEAEAAGEFGVGRYGPDATAAVYSELMRRSASLLQSGQNVILDASWARATYRERARELAARTHVSLIEFRCETPGGVAEARIQMRASEGLDPSEATPDVARDMALIADPWPEASVIENSGTIEDAVASIIVALSAT